MSRKGQMNTGVDQLQDMRISIIGTRSEIGALFESMIQYILSKQGYSNFQRRARKPGMELDLICTNNVTNKNIVVEAKAHQIPITTPELEKFHSKIVALQDERIESGIFWSLSGINSSGKCWYNALPQQQKQRLTIKGGTDFFNMLQDLEIIGSKSLIDDNLRSVIGKDFLERELVYFKNHWYYIQFFASHNTKDSFAILGSFGEITDNFTCQEIRKQYQKLESMKLILLASRKQILEILLQKDELTIDEITKELKEKQVDIQITIDDLIEQNLLTTLHFNRKQKFMIKRGLETFLTISYEFKQNSSVFMKSRYLQTSITNELMNFILQRFVIHPSKKQFESIAKIIMISPSALELLFAIN